MARQGKIELSPEEKSSLKDMLSKGRHTSREIVRAQILLKADSGMKKCDIQKQLGISYGTVFNILNTYRSDGLKAALHDAPRAGRKAHITPQERAHITAIACSAAPEGHQRWTLRLLSDRLVELNVVDSISHEHVRRILKKTI
jgi:putative transposase